MTAAPSASASRLSVSRHGGGVKHGPQSLRFEEVSISNICLSVRALHNFFFYYFQIYAEPFHTN